MGHKIFVSYKYADDEVKNLNYYQNSTVRDYVDIAELKLKELGHIYKCEGDNEDLSKFSNDEIREKLKDRMRDSTGTIIMISPNMVESDKIERNQWIPWEVSYSLKETHRKNEAGESIICNRNAMLAVVLPDSNGSYDYFLEDRRCCCRRQCIKHHTDKTFKIIANNMFNIKDPQKDLCSVVDESIWMGECSYIASVKWDDFIVNAENYVEQAYKRMENIDDYLIRVEI